MILPMTKPAEARVFVARVQASLREIEKTNPEFGACTLSMGIAESPLPRHHSQQRSGRGGQRAVPGQARRQKHGRGGGGVTMAESEFILLGDAVWLDFVNTARGRVPAPPDLLPDSAAIAALGPGPESRLGERHRPVTGGGAGVSPSAWPSWPRRCTPDLQPPPASIAAINQQLARRRRVPAADPGERRVAAPICPGPAAQSPGSHRPVRRGRPGGSAALHPALRRESCSLFFTDDSPNQSRRWCHAARVRPAGEGRAAARVVALTGPEPDRVFRAHPARRSGPATGWSGRSPRPRSGYSSRPRTRSSSAGSACG